MSSLVHKSKLKGLRRANQLLEEFRPYLADHPKGERLLDYYHQLEEQREAEELQFRDELGNLTGKINMIRNDVLAQKSYADAKFLVEEVSITDLVDDAVMLHDEALEQLRVELIKEYEELPPCKVVRIKLVNAVNNLLKNSLDSLAAIEGGCIRIRVLRASAEDVAIEVSDNGHGIEKAHLTKIFNYGFTTKDGATGIGLHMAANAMTEMNGAIAVESDGPGKGARFTLVLPFDGTG